MRSLSCLWPDQKHLSKFFFCRYTVRYKCKVQQVHTDCRQKPASEICAAVVMSLALYTRGRRFDPGLLQSVGWDYKPRATTSKVVKVFTKRHQARQKIIPSKWRHENGAKFSLIYGLYFASNLKCQFCLDICLLFSILFTSIFNIFNFNRSRNAI